jgi:uncharacterized repeat protein (TIGR03803 family)
MDAAGNLYGTTTHGGNLGRCGGGCGTVYELSPTANGDWEEHVLHRFGGVYDGAFPEDESLVVDKTGAVYGTTDVGGRRGYGTVFKLSRKAGRWKETILHNFANDTGGSNPAAGVVMDKSGNLYGTTVGGGDPNCGCGVMYKLAPRPHGKWKYAVLHTFVGSDGAEPAANLILDSKGNLYGTAQLGGSGHNGVAFELTP